MEKKSSLDRTTFVLQHFGLRLLKVKAYFLYLTSQNQCLSKWQFSTNEKFLCENPSKAAQRTSNLILCRFFKE